MTPPEGSARQRTRLAWQRTALDFAVVSGLLLRDEGGLLNPWQAVPAGAALLVAAAVVVARRRHPTGGLGRGGVRRLGWAAVAVAVLAGIALPLAR